MKIPPPFIAAWLLTLSFQSVRAEPPPPIPVEFSIEKPGYVTLVIEDAEGTRVRNMISETFFEAGKHVLHWDGLDESLKVNVQNHGVYEVAGKLVPPGAYSVRGLVRDEIEMFYEFTPFSSGTPPWRTADKTGAWLADHTPPIDVLYLPKKDEMLISAAVPEAGSGLIWVSRDGKKRTGVRWVGGHWTGAERLAYDAGPEADETVQAYVASIWKKGELRLNAILNDETARLVRMTADNEWGEEPAKSAVGGLAAFNGLLAVSLPVENRIEFVDAKTKESLGKVELKEPRGLAFDDAGRLFVLSGKELHSYQVNRGEIVTLTDPKVIVKTGLEAPQDLTFHGGQILISDQGDSHQVKMFDAKGGFVKAIGTPGKTTVGPYDQTRMTNPSGIAVTPDGSLWVAEKDPQIKRTSVYRIDDGSFVCAFHGPARYGSGGTIDPKDGTRFYYAGMEFAIDWEKGTDRIARIYRRPSDKDPNELLPVKASPERAIYVDDRQYLTDAFNESEVAGANPLSIWVMQDGVAKRVAVAGSFQGNEVLQKDAELLARLPEKFNPAKDLGKVMFVWSDLNDDGKVERDEIQLRLVIDYPTTGSFTVDPKLTLTSSFAFQLPVQRFTPGGAPVYDLAAAETKLADVSINFTSGGGQAMPVGDFMVITGGPMQGFKDGKRVWTYPSKWPGLHAGHRIPNRALEPGEMAGTTRLLGLPIRPHKGEAGEIWAVNADPGMMYLVTADGLFVTTLGTDLVQGKQWAYPEAIRGTKLDKINFIGENFGPTINQSPDGRVFLVCGKVESNFIRVEGLDSVKRITGSPIQLTPELHAKCEAYFAEQSAKIAEVDDVLKVGLAARAPNLDGKLDEWSGADWHSVYQFVIGKGKSAETKKYEAAIRVSGDTLYVGYRTPEKGLATNAATTLVELFKSGGALDVMLGTDPNADPKRNKAVAGDLRLLVAEVKGKILAGVFRPVDPNAKGDRVAFSSPWRTIEFDSVTDVSDQVKLKSEGGNYELAIPLAALGLKPEAGKSIRGDVGILRGGGGTTVQRLYWHNKATTLISDVPGEAQLTPAHWGELQFETVQP